MFNKLWNDDAGIVALEYLLVATIVGLSLVVGLGALAFGLNAELTELAQAISAINQTYGISGISVRSFGSSQPPTGASFAAFWNGWASNDIQQAGVTLSATPPTYTLTVDQVP
jgi:Flp pilus assembly pilin Flp